MARKKQPLQFPIVKDKERFDRGEQWAFAEGEQAKRWVCEEDVVVLIVEPQRGQRSWGLLWELPRNLLMRSPR